MKALIENLLEKHRENLEETFQDFSYAHSECNKACQGWGTTSDIDCRFLILMCLEKKPKKIIEIGTWVGNTSYAMSFATRETGAVIHTCDKASDEMVGMSKDPFVAVDCDEAERIKTNPDTWSSDLLKNKELLDGVDLVFNDANISLEDCREIYDLANNEFCFITHDYYNGGGGHEKGFEAIQDMKTVIGEKGGDYNLHVPESDWYYSGYKDNINGCCALMECKK